MRLSHSVSMSAAALVLTAAALFPTRAFPADDPWSSTEAWLCMPGRSDLCPGPSHRMTLSADGTVTREAVRGDPDAPIDCFYVYPTISTLRPSCALGALQQPSW